MIKGALAVLAVAALASSSAMAGSTLGVNLSKDKRVTSIAHGSSHYVAPPAHDPSLSTIFSNVGTYYPNGLYFCCYGDTISGSQSVIGQQFWVAGEFTPATDMTVKEIDAGVGYVTGTNEVKVGLYTDAGGVPGSKIGSFQATNLGTFGGCCTLAVFKKAKGGFAVTGGTPYWVTITTGAKDTWDAWNFNSTDQINPVQVAFNSGTGWQAGGGSVPAPSFAVYGK